MSQATMLRESRRTDALPLLDFQQEALDAVFAAWAKGVNRQVVSMPTGSGKCLGVGTPVLLYNGRIVPVEDVRAGDELMGPDSRPRRVLSTVRGRGPLYRIVPLRGRPWVCNDVHILSLVHTTTGEVVDVPLPDYLAASKNFRHLHKQFAPANGVEFAPLEAPLPVDPYFLGVWYGDGTKRLDRIAISKPDAEIRAAVHAQAERWGLEVREENSKSCPTYYIHGGRHGGRANPLLDALRAIVPPDFSIPRPYLVASRQERGALLAGLVDTDGHVYNGSLEIVQRNAAIADGIAFLARSLGFRVIQSEKTVNGDVYQRISIAGDLSLLPMRIRRKVGSPRRQLKCATRTGFAVEEIGAGEYAGFELAGDGRFLLGDFTVTHNTVLACHLIGTAGLPAVFLCHRDELVDQTRDKLRMFDPGLTVAICKAEQGREAWQLQGRDVVIASAQTVGIPKRRDVLTRAVGAGGLLIVDEAHHSAAKTWTETITALDPALLVGLTATPKRGDGEALDGLFDDITYSVPMRRLVEMGMLARPVGLRIGTSVDLDSVHSRGGEFVENELAVAVNSLERNALVVDAWERHALAEGRTRTIAFCVDVAHAYALAATFNDRGHRAAVIVGTTPKDERTAIYRELREGTLPILISVNVLTEGFDEPRVDTALMCRPTQSQSLYIQMAGRALRRAEGKRDALIIDFVDITRRHSLQTIMTLAGAEAKDVAEPGEEEPTDLFGSIGAAQTRKAKVRESSERLGDLIESSALVWQHVAGRAFVPAGQGEWITLVHSGDGYIPLRVFNVPNGPTGHEPLFGRPVDAETAMLIAQGRVAVNKLTSRGEQWRDGMPSPKQLDWFERMRLPAPATRGQASELMDQHFFKRAFRLSGAASLETEGKDDE